MVIKSIIALLLGLVIQLSQVPSCLAGEAEKPCVTSAQGMDCCKDAESCPCFEESDQKPQKPTPLIPESVDLKFLYSKAPETTRLEALIVPPGDAVLATASALEIRNGYSGVPLSVAFCRFLI